MQNLNMPLRRRSLLLAMAAAAISQPVAAQSAKDQKHPDVVDVKVRVSGPDLFDFEVTMTSPYDTAQRYADAFRVTNGADVSFAERVLLHDHADEQPFTRDLARVRIPQGIRSVTVQGRDQKHGYGGKTMQVVLPGR